MHITPTMKDRQAIDARESRGLLFALATAIAIQEFRRDTLPANSDVLAGESVVGRSADTSVVGAAS